MIEINLLPGAGKKARRAGMASGFSSAFSGLSGQVRDPYLIAAAVSAVVAVLVVGMLWMGQSSTESGLRERELAAVNDSARYATVILEKRRAEMRRDSVLLQVQLIEAIDNDRYIWPHVLAEVSKSMPPYTWIGSMGFINAVTSPAAPAPVDTAALAAATTAADSASLMAPRSNVGGPREAVQFEMTGYTVDVQAMTRLIRDMESSPFIQSVQLVDSKSLVQDGVTVTEFMLRAEYEIPDPSFIRRIPLSVTGR